MRLSFVGWQEWDPFLKCIPSELLSAVFGKPGFGLCLQAPFLWRKAVYFLLETVFLFIKTLLSHWSKNYGGRFVWWRVVVAVVGVSGWSGSGMVGGWLLFVHYLFDKHSMHHQLSKIWHHSTCWSLNPTDHFSFTGLCWGWLLNFQRSFWFVDCDFQQVSHLRTGSSRRDGSPLQESCVLFQKTNHWGF